MKPKSNKVTVCNFFVVFSGGVAVTVPFRSLAKARAEADRHKDAVVRGYVSYAAASKGIQKGPDFQDVGPQLF